jgi:hypothetical protein
MTSPSNGVPLERIKALLDASLHFAAMIHEHCNLDNPSSDDALVTLTQATTFALAATKTDPIGDGTGVR